jgi:hypothetical protein
MGGETREMTTATIHETDTTVTGRDRQEIADKIASMLRREYEDTGDAAWLTAEATDEDGTFTVTIEA